MSALIPFILSGMEESLHKPAQKAARESFGHNSFCKRLFTKRVNRDQWLSKSRCISRFRRAWIRRRPDIFVQCEHQCLDESHRRALFDLPSSNPCKQPNRQPPIMIFKVINNQSIYVVELADRCCERGFTFTPSLSTRGLRVFFQIGEVVLRIPNARRTLLPKSVACSDHIPKRRRTPNDSQPRTPTRRPSCSYHISF